MQEILRREGMDLRDIELCQAAKRGGCCWRWASRFLLQDCAEARFEASRAVDALHQYIDAHGAAKEEARLLPGLQSERTSLKSELRRVEKELNDVRMDLERMKVRYKESEQEREAAFQEVDVRGHTIDELHEKVAELSDTL